MTKLTDQLNKSHHKIQAKTYKKVTKDILRKLITVIPREDLIEMLIKKKIIKRDWEESGNKYSLVSK